MNNKDCKIVRDLLPSYIDGLTSKETNEFIKKHISECSDCSIVYENMKSIPLEKLFPPFQSFLQFDAEDME